MKILAIDPGVERVGIAILEKERGQKEQLIHSECFKTSAKLSHVERLALIGEKMKQLIDTHHPEALAIEKLFFETNVTTAMHVSEARGTILYVCVSLGLRIFEYTPLEIKVAVTGYGKSDKKAVMAMVPRLIRIEKERVGDDEMDAIAIGITAYAHNHI